MAKCDGESEKRSSGEKEELKVSSTGYSRVRLARFDPRVPD